MRVAPARSRALLAELGVSIASWVVAIGEASSPDVEVPHGPAALDAMRDRADDSPVRCSTTASAEAMVAAIDAARADKDSLGGVVEVVAHCGVPPGLGSFVHWDRKLDGRLVGP